ncbi:MAG: PLP-dependent aminotransferase family protein [Acidimicrobiia bacterium]|nr:PLP-dependent aminotransferase family protein [Acidimicrobiia bacterium]
MDELRNRIRPNSTTLDPDRLAGQLADWAAQPGALYAKLADALADLIATGVLRDGERLPPERTLATTLSVSRGTVVAAYDRLREVGLVSRVQGRGTTITVNHAAIGARLERPTAEPLIQPGSTIDLLIAVPQLLPRAASIARSVDVWSNAEALGSSEPTGLDELRTAIAELMTADGLPSTPDQIVVTAGAQQAISIATSLLVRPGDVVLCEEFTWPALVDAIRRAGAKVVGLPMDDHGIIVDELEGAIQRFRPSFIGLNPHHHNPTSTCLPPARRAAVMRLAAEYRVPVVEDRVWSRLGFAGAMPPPPLAALDPGGSHLVIDSISKVAWPGFRVGWIRANLEVVNDLRTTRMLFDLFSPPTTQLHATGVLADLDAVVADRIAQLGSDTRWRSTRSPNMRPRGKWGGLAAVSCCGSNFPRSARRTTRTHRTARRGSLSSPDALACRSEPAVSSASSPAPTRTSASRTRQPRTVWRKESPDSAKPGPSSSTPTN